MINKEYIEREAINELVAELKPKFAPQHRHTLDAFIYAIVDKIPTADVAPVVHGEWIPIISYFHGKPTGKYYCSVCHRVEPVKGIYCRLCGARMDGGKKNG